MFGSIDKRDLASSVYETAIFNFLSEFRCILAGDEVEPMSTLCQIYIERVHSTWPVNS